MISFEKTPLYFRLILPVLWYGFIFFLTELPFASGNNTKDAIGEIIIKVTDQDFNPYILTEWLNLIFRSSAHFFMFGIQAIFVYFLLKSDFNFNRKIFWLVSVGAIAVLGGLDEFHQSLVPERRPRFIDVCIDISGAVTLLYSALCLKYRYIQTFS
ncbi:MAG: VanZ family protein [Opitutaceae bacterium]|nr:VanZ family protein [Cytophagales bacterium]